jgi:hypothetical protein
MKIIPQIVKSSNPQINKSPLLFNKLKRKEYGLHLFKQIMLSFTGCKHIAIKRYHAVVSGIHESIANEGTAHKVLFNFP